MNMVKLYEDPIKKLVIDKIRKFDRKQTMFLAWLCSIRALPFIGADGNFRFWEKDNEINKHLFAIFNAIDTVANYNVTKAANIDTAYVDAANAISAAANNAAKAAAVDAAAANAAYNVAKAISAAACAAANPNSYAYVANTIASAIAAANVVRKKNIKLYSIIEEDISYINDDIYVKFNNDIGIYGVVWNNFQKALENTGCGYWGKLYEDIFHSGFKVDKKASRTRLRVLKEIKKQDAKEAAELLEQMEIDNSEIKNDEEGGEKSMVQPKEPLTDIILLKRTEVFICYSHDDKKYLDEIKKYLSVLNNFGIKTWYDEAINIGDDWERKISEHISRARVAILMVSQAFLNSDFIRNKELPELLSAAEEEQATIMWIPVTVSTVNNSPIESKTGKKIYINRYQAATDPKRPLGELTLSKRNKIYKKIHDSILGSRSPGGSIDGMNSV